LSQATAINRKERARAKGSKPPAKLVSLSSSRQELRSLADLAYEQIKERIQTLAYRPGQYLNESAICNELGFSRTPVHQAIHRLQVESLLEIIPRKGLIVRADSLNEMLDLVDARWLTEPHATGLAAERASPAQIDALQNILDEARDSLPKRQPENLYRFDAAFHRGVLQASGNRVLQDIVGSLHDRSARLWHLNVWSDENLFRTQDEHEAILAAIRAGDKTEATEAAQRHIMSLRRPLAMGSDLPG
jgi:GntR family transcriptional regulator, rspAB operon transcriptional repressor